MAVKDKVMRWFIQNVIVPKSEIIDSPGFLVTQFTQNKQNVFLREVALPESVFVLLEDKIRDEYGEKGCRALYSAGKKFGHHYAHKSLFPSVKAGGPKEVEKFLYNFVRYAEATSYGRMDYSIDMEKGTAKISLKDYMVCPHNGLGYLFTWGSISGLWSYMMSSPSLEGVQVKCQGQRYKNCEVFCAQPKVLKSKSLVFYSQSRLPEYRQDAYNQINRIIKPQFSSVSFKDMIDSSYLKYKNGVVQRKKQRYFIIESSFVYMLESELKKLKGANDILFDLAFSAGQEIAKGEKSSQKFLSEIVSAFGWGDILVLQKSGKFSVFSSSYPWSHLSSSSKYCLYRGFLSGILSQIEGRKVILKKASKSITGSMSLSVSE